jgi:hypothetical protein
LYLNREGISEFWTTAIPATPSLSGRRGAHVGTLHQVNGKPPGRKDCERETPGGRQISILIPSPFPEKVIVRKNLNATQAKIHRK